MVGTGLALAETQVPSIPNPPRLPRKSRCYSAGVMNAMEAMKAAAQILDEERARPTVGYTDMANAYVFDPKGLAPEQVAVLRTITSTPRFNLTHHKTLDPRPVNEHTFIYKFSGINFDLLMNVYSQLNEPERPHLVNYVLRRVGTGGTGSSEKPTNHSFPVLDGEVCELPLIAEFCIRTRNFEDLFVATAKRSKTNASLSADADPAQGNDRAKLGFVQRRPTRSHSTTPDSTAGDGRTANAKRGSGPLCQPE
jgi:hypothetical protein